MMSVFSGERTNFRSSSLVCDGEEGVILLLICYVYALTLSGRTHEVWNHHPNGSAELAHLPRWCLHYTICFALLSDNLSAKLMESVV